MSTVFDQNRFYRIKELQEKIKELNNGKSLEAKQRVILFRNLFSYSERVANLKENGTYQDYMTETLFDDHMDLIESYYRILECGASELCDRERSYFYICNELNLYQLDRKLVEGLPEKFQSLYIFDEMFSNLKHLSCSNLSLGTKLNMKNYLGFDVLDQ